MGAAVCQACGQPLRERRFGIVLTPFKASVVDLIRRAGDLGISSDELRRELYRDHAKPPSKFTIKAHVWQLNELLAATDWVIESDRRRWFLRRRQRVFGSVRGSL
jgi:hypothetical protein